MTQDIEALLVELDANAKVDRRHGFTHDAEIWERAAAAIREFERDAERYQFVRPIMTQEGREGDKRALLIAKALFLGIEGDAAIDHAMKAYDEATHD